MDRFLLYGIKTRAFVCKDSILGNMGRYMSAVLGTEYIHGNSYFTGECRTGTAHSSATYSRTVQINMVYLVIFPSVTSLGFTVLSLVTSKCYVMF